MNKEQWLALAQSKKEQDLWQALSDAALIAADIQDELLFWFCTNNHQPCRAAIYPLLDEAHKLLFQEIEHRYYDNSLAHCVQSDAVDDDDRQEFMIEMNEEAQETRRNWLNLATSANPADHKIAIDLLPLAAPYIQDALVIWAMQSMRPYHIFLIENHLSESTKVELPRKKIPLYNSAYHYLPDIIHSPNIYRFNSYNNMKYWRACLPNRDMIKAFLFMEFTLRPFLPSWSKFFVKAVRATSYQNIFVAEEYLKIIESAV